LLLIGLHYLIIASLRLHYLIIACLKLHYLIIACLKLHYLIIASMKLHYLIIAKFVQKSVAYPSQFVGHNYYVFIKCIKSIMRM